MSKCANERMGKCANNRSWVIEKHINCLTMKKKIYQQLTV